MQKISALKAHTVDEDWPEQLAVRVARSYYELGLTQQEIASELNIGRARVIRLLADARKRGIVSITIHSPLLENVELAEALVERYGLRMAEVCLAARGDELDVARQIASAAGPFITPLLKNNQTIGLGWGITLKAFVSRLQPLNLSAASVASLLGSLTRRSTITRYEASTDLAAKLNAECLYLPAPTICDTVYGREILTDQPMFKEVFQRALNSDIAIVSIGGLDSATIRAVGMVSDTEFEAVTGIGAVGNFMGYFIDADGHPVEHDLNHRVVGVRQDDFIKIPHRVMISGGQNKVKALRAVLGKGLLTGLVTDDKTARALLA